MAIISTTLPFSEDEILRLDKNENPFSLPPSPREELRQTLCQVALNRYPESQSSALRASLSRYLDVKTDQVLVGNGGDELLYLIFIKLLKKEGPVLTLEPTFSEYDHLCQIFCRQRQSLPIRLSDQTFSIDEEAFLDALSMYSPSLVLLDTPNNPTGMTLSSAFLERVISLAPCPVLIDEAYVEFCGSSIIDQFRGKPWPDNLIVLRTLSKAWGMAGLRLGYIAAAPDFIASLETVRPSYNVNALSQEAALITLRYREWMESRVFSLRYIRDLFIREMNRLDGWRAFDSQANFVLVATPWEENRTQSFLAKANVKARLFRLPGREECFLRLSVGKEEEMRRFLSCLEEEATPYPELQEGTGA